MGNECNAKIDLWSYFERKFSQIKQKFKSTKVLTVELRMTRDRWGVKVSES